MITHQNQYTYPYRTPLGPVTLAGNEEALTGLWFDGQKYDRATLAGTFTEKKLPVFEQAIEWLDIYFSGREPGFLPKLAPAGSMFRQEVYRILLTVPYGQTTTYGKIADRIAAIRNLNHMSAQAAGGAVGHNPISIMIPCHRVLGADGSLTGYAGGTEKKKQLLELEQKRTPQKSI